MKKIIVLSLISILILGCTSNTTPNQEDNTSNTNSSTSQINTEDIQPGAFTMKEYFETSAITDQKFNLGQLEVKNNGVKQHDLTSIADNEACQTFLSNAMMVDLEITNNYDQTITYGLISDIWGMSDVITDKTLDFMDSEDFANGIGVLSDEFYGTLTPYFFQGDFLGTCFQEQNDRFSAQPGETVNYPLYFSLPDRWTENAETWYLSLNPDTFSLEEGNPIKELEYAEPVIIELNI